MGTAERVLRIVLGGALAAWAPLLQLLAGPPLLWLLLDIALVALGVDFVTGVRGYCPPYKRLEWSTAGPLAGAGQ